MKTYLAGGIIALIVVALVILLANEIPHFHYVIEVVPFIKMLLISSLVMGLIAAYFVGLRMEGVDKLRVYLIFAFFSFIPVLGLGSWLNRQTDKLDSKEVKLISYEPRFASAYGVIEGESVAANQFVVTFEYKGRLIRKVSDVDLGLNVDALPQTIDLKFYNGLLGYDFVGFH